MTLRKTKTAPNIARTHQQMRGEVDKLRTEIEAVQGEIEWTKSAPLPRGEVKNLLNAWISEQGEKFPGSQVVSGAVTNHRVNIDVLSLSGRMDGRATEGFVTGFAHTDLAPLMCYLLGDVLRERLSAELAQVDYQPGPPAAERPGLIEKLEADLLAQEVVEERLVVEAEAAGLEIPRRLDCNPEVVLDFQE